jgi:hypothetical protein
MPNTYSYIAKYQLTGTTTTVDFTSIPNTYDDLVFRFNARASNGSFSNNQMRFQYNNDTSNIYYAGWGRGDGSSAFAYFDTIGAGYIGLITSDGAAAGYFSTGELYIPNYAGNKKKISYSHTVGTNDSSPMYTNHQANVWQSTSAITSVKFIAANSEFMANSTFYLYGIKNA